jgi:hypothetical protein
VFPAVVGLLQKHVERRLCDKTINVTIDWCIWLGVLFEYLKMHGTTNPKSSSQLIKIISVFSEVSIRKNQHHIRIMLSFYAHCDNDSQNRLFYHICMYRVSDREAW